MSLRTVRRLLLGFAVGGLTGWVMGLLGKPKTPEPYAPARVATAAGHLETPAETAAGKGADEPAPAQAAPAKPAPTKEDPKRAAPKKAAPRKATPTKAAAERSRSTSTGAAAGARKEPAKRGPRKSSPPAEPTRDPE